MTAYRAYGDILHYEWGGDGRVHSSVMVIATLPEERLLLLPIADTHFSFGSRPIVSKAAAMYEPCTPSCPHHPFNKENT